MTPTIAAALLAACAAAADPLADLQATLAGLAGTAPVAARFTHHFESRTGEGKEARLVQGDVSGRVAEGSDGLDLRWGQDVLGRAREEVRRRATDGEATTPTRDGIAELDAMDLARRLDVAAELRDALAGATLLEDRPDALDGAPARLLVLRLAPALGQRDRKYVKEVDATGRIWLGPDGVPLAAETRIKLSGRAFLVITFEQEERELVRVARVGDRLVATRHERERKGEGAGEKSERRSTTVLELLPARG